MVEIPVFSSRRGSKSEKDLRISRFDLNFASKISSFGFNKCWQGLKNECFHKNFLLELEKLLEEIQKQRVDIRIEIQKQIELFEEFQ